MSNTITGTVTVGVTLALNPTIIDGTIATGDGDAVYGSAAETWTLANNGKVDAYSGVGILIGGGAQITNAAHASIYGRFGGIDVAGDATIDNAGSIGADTGVGIFIDGAGAVTNAAGGVISSFSDGIVAQNDNFNLLNQGVISGTYLFRVDSYGVKAAGMITNASSGTIIGDEGIALFAGTINNAGLIEGRTSSYGDGYAIILGGDTDEEIIEQKTGTIIGGILDFVGGDTIDEAGITITSVALIKGTDKLALFDGAARLGTLSLSGYLINDEFILKSDGHGGTDIEIGAAKFTGTYAQSVELSALSSTIAAHARIDGVDAWVERYFTLVNHGTIVSLVKSFDAVEFSASGRITNTGLIEGDIGIRADGGLILNAGQVEGGAIGIDATGGTIINSGVIEGKTGILADGGGGTIANYGTIDGSAGIAIDLLSDTAATSIILRPGSVLEGGIEGFAAGDTIDLAGINATGETFANGVLTLTEAGKVVDTLALDGVVNSAAFKLAAAKGGGTDIFIAPAVTFTGHYRSGLVISSLLTSITSKASFANGVTAPSGRDWTVVNAGTISGHEKGVLLQGGNFTNTGTGTIDGASGVYLEPPANSFGLPSLTNAGSIIGLKNAGVVMDGFSFAYSYGFVSNLKSGSISGAYAGVIMHYAGNLLNAGQISGDYGVSLQGGTFSNTGQVSGAIAGVKLQGGTVVNAGQVSGQTGVIVDYGGKLYNTGLIDGHDSAASVGSTGLLINGGNVTNAAQGIISGDTGVDLTTFESLTDAGTIATDHKTGGTAIDFIGEFATLVLDRGNVIEGAIAGFQSGDIIDFAATTITTDSFSNNILTLFDGAETIETLTLFGTYSQGEFSLVSDGALGTELIIGTDTIGSLAAASMAFLRPTLWGPPPHPESLPPPPYSAAKKPAPVAIPSTLAGWLTLDPAVGPTVPPMTLHAG